MYCLMTALRLRLLVYFNIRTSVRGFCNCMYLAITTLYRTSQHRSIQQPRPIPIGNVLARFLRTAGSRITVENSNSRKPTRLYTLNVCAVGCRY